MDIGDDYIKQFQFPDVTEFTYGGSDNYVQQLFQKAEDKRKKNTSRVFGEFAAASPVVASMLDGLKTNQNLKIVISEEAKRNIANKVWSFANVKDKDGFFRAFVLDENGKIVENAMLKKEDVMKGVNLSQLATAMQGMAIQQQLEDISIDLDSVMEATNDILAGQHNDRLGLYYSAEFMYRESQLVNNRELRENMKIMSLSNLSNAIEQIKQTTIYELDKISRNYDQRRQRFIGNINQNEVISIKTSFGVIHKAIALKNAIYCDNNEHSAAVYTLLEYKDFLVRSLDGNRSTAIYYADTSEKNLGGFWSSKKNKYPQRIDQIVKEINDLDRYCICYSKGGVA